MDFINSKESMDGLVMYGAFLNNEIVGVVATGKGNHTIPSLQGGFSVRTTMRKT